jgi:hypothetical protein
MGSSRICGIAGPALALLGLSLVVRLACGLAVPTGAQAAPVHTTYVWHMHQPIYWPDKSTWYPTRYETAYETITLGHSQSNVYDIFNKDDRVHDYQDYPKYAISTIKDLDDAAAQVSFAAALVENVKSLGDAGWNGGRYASNWYNDYRTARAWKTSGNHSRLDQLVVAAHHPIAPLMDENAFRKELQVAKVAYQAAWGDTNFSKGYYPAEECFSERLIPVLVEQGLEWAVVADVHLSRACADYPYEANQDNCDPPNPADQINPAQGYYDDISISRGVTVKTPPPFGFQPHRARYVDPATGQARSLVVVPAANAESWNEGYGTYGTGEIDAIAPYNDPTKPMLVLLAHDGDNNWSGGYSYYHENVTGFCHQAAAKGYEPTAVAEYLADHPVASSDYVHVEDGGWVNADGDFGSPQFINWNWPLVSSGGDFDIPGGWAEDERNWAVLTAAENRVETAEAISGVAPSAARIYDPTGGATAIEKAWHHLLSGYESGYMYYGTSLDMEVKATLAANAACDYADPVIAGGTDVTAPTVWIPQRLPWNPGGFGGGALWGYPGGDGEAMPSDFWVWTFVHDVSGLERVHLKYRLDADGTNPMTSDQNETYAGGADVGAWQTAAMTRRVFPKGNFFNDPNINFSVLPHYIADEYYVQVTGLSEVLVDYYVEAEDSLGHVKRSPIQHVWVGEPDQPPAHVIDGALDANSTLVASNAGLTLYADWDGEFLYLAMQGVGATSGWDHFIILGTDLATPVSAPWAKAVTVADRTLYLGNEDSNNWCGWFNSSETVVTDGVASASGSYLEGTARLATYLGTPLPAGVYLAAAAYASADGGALQAQAPVGDGDGAIEAAEYAYFALATGGIPGGGTDRTASRSTISIAPNPCQGHAKVIFSMPVTGWVTVSVFDLLGRHIATLIDGPAEQGANSVTWNGLERSGRPVAAGVYLLRLESHGAQQTRKFVLAR